MLRTKAINMKNNKSILESLNEVKGKKVIKKALKKLKNKKASNLH